MEVVGNKNDHLRIYWTKVQYTYVLYVGTIFL